ncbi:MAG: chemotaxis protein CheA [Candidatus Cloacimonadota bacterium]|nr:MAG: chemotaxis protein CheA [Candidatus Cloacimonadota bacterium]
MKEIDISKYASIFRSETREYLVQLNQYILKLEKETHSSETIDAIFRNYHTIKGMAGTMGYKLMESVAHSLEDLLTLIRNGTLTVSSSIIDLLLEGTDTLEYLVENPEDDRGDIHFLLERISNISKERETLPGEKKQPFTRAGKTVCEIYLKENSPFNGARAAVLIANMETMSEITGYSPERSVIECGDFDRRFSLTVIPRIPIDEIQKKMLAYSDVEMVNVMDETKRMTASIGVHKKSDIRVGIKKLDNLQNLLSELVITKESLKGFVRANEQESILNETDRIASIVSDLQDEVVKIRMVPIWQVFERFPRVIRDTAKELGKEVDFEIRGKDIELDRSMLENLAEPLLHLLRNSIYHGIENPQEREKLGKPRKGKLIIKATRRRGIVLVQVSDDGRGMDTQKILMSAVERGLVAPEKAKSLSEKEILDFIFVSGFSTSESVDEVSGRGVGMDVVKTSLRKLGGTFDFKTERNRGTEFILKVPLTMAIIKAFLVDVGGDAFAIPLTFVEETIELNKNLIKSIHSKEVFILRDEVIPVKRLHRIFGIQNGNVREMYPAVIVKAESKKAALITSEFLEHTDIVVKMLPRTQAEIKEFAGVTLLSDGKPALIIDVPHIV